MLAGVGDATTDGVALGDGAPDAEPADGAPAGDFADVEAQAAVSPTIATRPSPDRIAEPTPNPAPRIGPRPLDDVRARIP